MFRAKQLYANTNASLNLNYIFIIIKLLIKMWLCHQVDQKQK